MQLKRAVAILVLCGSIGSSQAVSVLLGGKPKHALLANASSSAVKTATAAGVAKLHKKLEAVATGLEGMLSPQERGSLANSKVAPAFRAFLKELYVTLSATEKPRDLPAAMAKLRHAEAGEAELVSSLNQQQEALMHEDAVEQTNLLMGVLMTRRAEPFDEQLEVLRSKDFSGLPVSKALLAKHDAKTPLFQQAAEFMDAHGSMAANTMSTEEKAQKLAKTISYFEQRVTALEAQEQVMQKMYTKRDTEFDKLIATGGNDKTKKEAHKFLLMKRQSAREHRKKILVHQQQTKMMKDVVAALKHGDMAALKKAQGALQAHMDAVQRQSGNFLHLLQLGHHLAKKDCPFCVAQCIGKCHDSGSPYAMCLAQCADSGQ